MPLPSPDLDDRRFQDIVDQAKRLIPQYCPEWTDHNVSDPGVTLIELFAWMTELLLYRVNQVPDKIYIQLLELLGIRLEPPRPARTRVTFYLSAPQPTEITIKEDTVVATVRTETAPAIEFSTEADLHIRPAQLLGAFTYAAVSQQWQSHDLSQLGRGWPGDRVKIPVFSDVPKPNDALYLSLGADLSNHVLVLRLACEEAGGQGVDPTRPPIIWETWQGGSGWLPCDLEVDETGGFNYPQGDVVLRLPRMERARLNKTVAYWLRCRLTSAQSSEGYRVPPKLESIEAMSRGGSVWARQASTATREVLGFSDGEPGQQFTLLQTPVLASHADTPLQLRVEPPGEAAQLWSEVRDFSRSAADDQHFVVDAISGQLTFGPHILQPDASLYRFGAIPQRGSRLLVERYLYGGGVRGNVAAGTLTVLKTAIPYIAHVQNHTAATGGRDAETLDHARMRAAKELSISDRAVTASDFSFHAEQVHSVARAHTVGPGELGQGSPAIQPGTVQVLVVPDIVEPGRWLSTAELVPSDELLAAVTEQIQKRCPLGIRIQTQAPAYRYVIVEARIVRDRSARIEATALQEAALEALFRFLNPLTGGRRGAGWPFARALYQSELSAVLQQVDGVEFVERIGIRLAETAESTTGATAPERITIAPDAVIASARHVIKVL